MTLLTVFSPVWDFLEALPKKKPSNRIDKKLILFILPQILNKYATSPSFQSKKELERLFSIIKQFSY